MLALKGISACGQSESAISNIFVSFSGSGSDLSMSHGLMTVARIDSCEDRTSTRVIFTHIKQSNKWLNITAGKEQTPYWWLNTTTSKEHFDPSYLKKHE